MNKPDDIPQGVWDDAERRPGDRFLLGARDVAVEIIARAIMAERESCALIADGLAEIDPEEDGIDPYEEWEISQRVCAKSIANMIRKRSTES